MEIWKKEKHTFIFCQNGNIIRAKEAEEIQTDSAEAEIIRKAKETDNPVYIYNEDDGEIEAYYTDCEFCITYGMPCFECENDKSYSKEEIKIHQDFRNARRIEKCDKNDWQDLK